MSAARRSTADDDQYLMASYRPGNRAPDPSDGLATGVMIAMNGPTPTPTSGRPAFPGKMLDRPAVAMTTGTSSLRLPAFGPIAPERPAFDGFGNAFRSPWRRFPMPRKEAGRGFGLRRVRRTERPDAVLQSWKRMNNGIIPSGEPYVAAASFTDAGEADRLAKPCPPLAGPRSKRPRSTGRSGTASICGMTAARRSTTCSRRRGRTARRTR